MWYVCAMPRMRHKRRASSRPGGLVCVLLCVALSPGPPAAADDADDIAAEIVRQTPNRAEAAKKILDKARTLTDSPSVQIRLCEKAYEQGMVAPGGYPTAIAALNLLDRVAPTRIDTWREKRIEVYRLQYYRSTRNTKDANGRIYVKLLLAHAKAAGKTDNWRDATNYYRQAYQVAGTIKLPEKTEIYEESRIAATYEAVHKRINVLRTALGKDPGDPFSRKQLVVAHLIDLDRPKEALKFLNDKVDPALHRNVTLAAKKVSELADADFLALTIWYRSLAAKAALKHAKINMLTRALEHISRYLEVYTKQDAHRLLAAKMLTSIQAELKKLGAEVALRPQFPPGIVLAYSFNAGQWFKAPDGRTWVRDVSQPRTAAEATPLDGANRGGTLGAPGKVGTGIAFASGSRALLEIPRKATAGLTTFTFAFWVKTTESGKGSTYWTHPTLLGYRTDGSGSRDFGITSYRGYVVYWSGLDGRRDLSYQSRRVRINDGSWHHIALTNDGKTLLLYVDARSVSSAGLPTGQPLRDMPVPLGASGFLPGDRAGSFNHSGTYDELHIYNRALTAEQVAALARGPAH